MQKLLTVDSATDFDRRYFWKWTDFRSYVEFIALFTLAASMLTYTFLDSVIYVEVLGFTSLLIEAMLGLPQFYDNYVSKSTFGMRYDYFIRTHRSATKALVIVLFPSNHISRAMVFMWLVGDSFKTFYFLSRRSPLQFSVCGSLQIAVDLAILSQAIIYGSSPGRRKDSNVLK